MEERILGYNGGESGGKKKYPCAGRYMLNASAI